MSPETEDNYKDNKNNNLVNINIQHDLMLHGKTFHCKFTGFKLLLLLFFIYYIQQFTMKIFTEMYSKYFSTSLLPCQFLSQKCTVL